MANFLKPFNDFLARGYSGDLGKMLVHTGVVGWILSSCAQVVAIAINEKIPKDQKTYMILQEMADGGINILSFYLITQSFKTVASKLVSTGKFLPKAVSEYLERVDTNKILGKVTTDVSKDFQMPKEILDKYKSHDNGVGFMSTLLGSIISCNFVTPVLRNIYAANRQKSVLAKMDEYEKKQNSRNPNFEAAPIQRPTTYQRPTLDAFRTQGLKI